MAAARGMESQELETIAAYKDMTEYYDGSLTRAGLFDMFRNRFQFGEAETNCIISALALSGAEFKKERGSAMKLDKERYLETEYGRELADCIKAWDEWIRIGDEKAALWCQEEWEVYQKVIKQLYGVEYRFTRTEECFGLVNLDNENDWLFKVERGL